MGDGADDARVVLRTLQQLNGVGSAVRDGGRRRLRRFHGSVPFSG
ncbi:MAG TPA: hypothetical protein VFJ91_10825 [Gaiellaceae bacterium]|nr:hypothetical protein [Gaiellaceae bacterium]